MVSRSLRFDDAEVAKLADVLVHAAGVAPAEARKVVAKGALNVKTDARRRVSGSRHFPALPGAITYETRATASSVSADVGPEQDRRQGNLAHIVEYGTPKTAPRPFMAPAGDAERPKFERAMEDLAVKALGRGFA